MGNWSLEAILRDLVMAWRLLWDPKVPTMLKVLIPVAALVYCLWPLDLLPFLPFDDIAVVILAMRLFAQMASSAAGTNRDGFSQAQPPRNDDTNTIDTTWRVVDPDR
jgi:uncharacterized membrane protein YkvA (DUF1232 family)